MRSLIDDCMGLFLCHKKLLRNIPMTEKALWVGAHCGGEEKSLDTKNEGCTKNERLQKMKGWLQKGRLFLVLCILRKNKGL